VVLCAALTVSCLYRLALLERKLDAIQSPCNPAAADYDGSAPTTLVRTPYLSPLKVRSHRMRCIAMRCVLRHLRCGMLRLKRHSVPPCNATGVNDTLDLADWSLQET